MDAPDPGSRGREGKGASIPRRGGGPPKGEADRLGIGLPADNAFSCRSAKREGPMSSVLDCNGGWGNGESGGGLEGGSS